MEVRDTSKGYDDLVGFKAKETIKSDLSILLGEQTEQKPDVYTKPIDPDFPESWQTLLVSIRNNEDYIEFMKLIGEAPGPKVKTVVFSKVKDYGLLKFLDEE